MTPEQAATLRAPFPPEATGKLPRVTCKACQDKNCTKHERTKCLLCGNWITTAHIHLDYVGHAAVTDRLLQVDPAWSWEPVSVGADGAPSIQTGGRDAVLWIRLTVCDVTRPGVGIAPVGAFELEKQLISDALRNAAMRFGVALDLWSKEDLHAAEPEPERASAEDRAAINAALQQIHDIELRARTIAQLKDKWPDLLAEHLEAVLAHITRVRDESRPFFDSHSNGDGLAGSAGEVAAGRLSPVDSGVEDVRTTEALAHPT